MYNHLRTLLLNQGASQAYGDDYPGEEMVPADYSPVVLPPPLQDLRSLLFGSAPDRAYLNYRLCQLMRLIHYGELAEHALLHDARITYLESPNDRRLRQAPEASIVALAGARDLFLYGVPQADDSRGRMFFQWRVSLDTPSSLTVSEQGPQPQARSLVVTSQAGLSSTGLVGAGLALGFPAWDGTGEPPAWQVEALARPGRSLPAVFVDLDARLGDGEQLFTGTGEPWDTWRNLWQNQPEAPLRLTAVVLALGEQTENLRNG